MKDSDLMRYILKLLYNLGFALLVISITYFAAYPFLEGSEAGMSNISRNWHFLRGKLILYNPGLSESQVGVIEGTMGVPSVAEAIESLTGSISQTPNDYQLYLWRGQLRSWAHQDDLAVVDYRQALGLAPEEEKGIICVELSKSYFRLGKYRLAWKALNDMTRYGKHFLWVSTEYKADFCYHIGATRCALRELFLANSLLNSPADRDYYVFIGDLYKWKNDIGKAIQAYTKSIEAFPDNNRSYYELGVIYWQLEQYEESAKNLRDCLQLCPEDHKREAGRFLGNSD